MGAMADEPSSGRDWGLLDLFGQNMRLRRYFVFRVGDGRMWSSGLWLVSCWTELRRAFRVGAMADEPSIGRSWVLLVLFGRNMRLCRYIDFRVGDDHMRSCGLCLVSCWAAMRRAFRVGAMADEPGIGRDWVLSDLSGRNMFIRRYLVLRVGDDQFCLCI